MGDKLTLKRYLALFAISAKVDFAWLMRDSGFAILAISADLLSKASSISGVFLLAWRFGGIGGMNADEVLFMLSYSVILSGVFQLFCCSNNGNISRIIGRGQLDHLMMQPLPIWAQLTSCGFFPFTSSTNLIFGVGLMAYSINNLGLTLTWWFVLSLVGNVLLTFVILIALSYLASTLAFYAPVQAEEISSYVLDLSGYISTFPLSGMPFYMQLPLITIIPSGLMAWFPTMILLGKPPLGLSSFYQIAFAIFVTIIATIFFKRGFNYYVKKGINRYVRWGFRS